MRISDCGLRISDYLWECAVLIEVATMERVYDCGFRTADCGFRTGDCGLGIAVFGLFVGMRRFDRSRDYGEGL